MIWYALTFDSVKWKFLERKVVVLSLNYFLYIILMFVESPTRLLILLFVLTLLNCLYWKKKYKSAIIIYFEIIFTKSSSLIGISNCTSLIQLLPSVLRSFYLVFGRPTLRLSPLKNANQDTKKFLGNIILMFLRQGPSTRNLDFTKNFKRLLEVRDRSTIFLLRVFI